MAELKKFIETDSDNETVDVNGKLNFPKNQYIKDNNYAINLNNSDIWKANSVWFADKLDTSNEGLIFPRSDGKWDSLSVLDGQIKLRTGVTIGMGESPSGGTTQVIADYVVEQGISAGWTYQKWNSGIAECWCINALPAGSITELKVVLPFDMADTNYVVSLTPGNNASVLTTPVRECGKDSGNAVRTVNSFYMSAKTSSSWAININIDVKGRWK